MSDGFGSGIRNVDHKGLARALALSCKAGVPLHIEGAPGIGKTEAINAFGKASGVPVYPLELAQCDPSDIGGIPVNVGGAIVRLPIGPLKACSEGPGILFGDEVSQAPDPLQGAFLTLANEGRAGDFRLHPDTRIFLASNPVDTGSGLHEILPTMVNRICTIRLVPSQDDVISYLSGIGQPGSALRDLGADYGATLDVSPGLLELSQPKGSNKTWASPRAIVKGLKICAEVIDGGSDLDSDPVGIAMLAGVIGESSALAYLAIRKLRAKLPSKAEILADPDKARLPPDVETAIGVIGVLAQVALADASAAWIYASRMAPEPRAAAGRTLTKYVPNGKRAPQGTRARALVLGSTGAQIGLAG